MQRPGYERFGLVVNPFHDLSSEGVEEIEIYHVPQAADDGLESLKQQVLERQAKGLAAVVGPQGSGKTQRLLVTASQAKRLGAFACFLQAATDARATFAALAEGMAASAALTGLARLSPPKWLRALKSAAAGRGKPDGARVGVALAQALGANAPAFLLVNDVDALPAPEALEVLRAIEAAATQAQAGVLVLMSLREASLEAVQRSRPSLATRLNRVVGLGPLRPDEARLILAKRLTGRRLVEDLDALYPFTPEAVSVLAAAAATPRALLQMADLVLEQAVRERVLHIGADVAQRALEAAPARAAAGGSATRPPTRNGAAAARPAPPAASPPPSPARLAGPQATQAPAPVTAPGPPKGADRLAQGSPSPRPIPAAPGVEGNGAAPSRQPVAAAKVRVPPAGSPPGAGVPPKPR